MEDIGVLQTEREETTLYDGREWRIHYWILNVNRIIELSKVWDKDAGQYLECGALSHPILAQQGCDLTSGELWNGI